MAKIKKKEIIDMWGNTSLIDIKNHINILEESVESAQTRIDANIEIMNNIDKTNEKQYFYKLKECLDSIKWLVDDIETTKEMLKILNEIFLKKQKEDTEKQNYQKYIDRNKNNIKPLVDAVENKLQEFIKNGCKILIPVNKEMKEIIISEIEARKIHEQLLEETIYIIMDKVGDITEVCNIKYNNKRGFDCVVIGTKANIRIQTVLAGGWNIQELHYRTLVNKI